MLFTPVIGSLALSLLLVSSSVGQGQRYEIDAAHSTLGFSVKVAGGLTDVEGKFLDNAVEMLRRLRGQIALRPGRSIAVDGRQAPGEWDDAASVAVEVPQSTPVRVYYKHDGAHLLFGFTGFTDAAFRVPEVVLDLNNDKSGTWQEDDWWFHASFTDCWSRGRFNDYDTCVAETEAWTANNLQDAEGGGTAFPAIVEMQIPFATLGWTPEDGQTIGIAFNATNTNSIWNFWPSSAQIGLPSTWAEAVVHLAPSDN